MRMIKLGIIGIGNMGGTHLKQLSEGKCPEIKVTAIADISAERRAAVSAQYPEVSVYESGDDLIDSGCCEAVLIATPHYFHPPLAIRAFGKGLHVLCEKPAGVYTLQVREMMAAADARKDLTFAMMFNQRTNCVFRKMKEMIDGGAVGDIKRVNYIITNWYRTQAYYDSGSWRATWAGEGGGVLLNQCPHQLDMLQWLTGLPEKVWARCLNGKWHDIEVEDDVTAYLTYPNGATGVFVTTTADAPGTNRLEITGTRGTLIYEDEKLTYRRLEADERTWCRTCPDAFKAPGVTVEQVETDGMNEQHIGVLNAFAAHILRGDPLIADGREGIRGLTLGNAMHLSDWTNAEVTLPFDEERFLHLLNERRAVSRLKTGQSVYANTEGTY